MGITERQDGDERAGQLAEEAIAAGRDTEWFDRLYLEARAGRTDVPWDRGAPHPLVVDWVRETRPAGAGRRAVVVGCGLGYDAELLAGLGFTVTAFDVAETGIAMARAQHPGSPVEYLTADLFALPAQWRGGFDLVVEVFTVQSLPVGRHVEATARITELVADGGTLVAVTASREDEGVAPNGPPWRLTSAEIDAFTGDGLVVVRREQLPHPDDETVLRWRVELRRP